MTTEEIFKGLSSHMIKGMMIHDKMADYYDFLSLRGYKRCHEYHFKKESACYRKLHRYFLNHYHRLIEEEQIEAPDIIPASWYRYTRSEVDVSTKRNAVKNGMEKWAAWEKDTKAYYEKAYMDLLEAGDVDGALFVQHLVEEVDCELKWAERKILDLSAADYNMAFILGEQKHIHDKYKKML